MPELNGGYRYRARVGAGPDSRPVLEYLSARYRHSTRAQWRSRLKCGLIEIDGAIATETTMLRRGQLLIWNRPPWREPEAPLSFAVLYEDADLLAVAKPSGLPTVPAGGYLEHTLLAQVRRRYPGASPAHRLGRGTSGIVLFARSTAARAQLAADWRARRVEKIYHAVVEGKPGLERFSIDTPIGAIPWPKLGRVHSARPDGKPSLSRVRVIERREDTSLVEVTIDSGRPHQIRIHLAAAGHPLRGDRFYGPGGLPRLSSGALPGDSGYALHASRLRFGHPADRRPVTVDCPPPALLRPRAGPTAPRPC